MTMNLQESRDRIELQKAWDDFYAKVTICKRGIPFKENSDIIKVWDESLHPRDERGRFTDSGSSKTLKSQKMSRKEYFRLCRQIATDFPNLKADGTIYNYENRNHFYIFTVIEFGCYSFSCKIPINGNEEHIKKLKASGRMVNKNKDDELTQKEIELLKLFQPYREEDTSKERETFVITYILMARDLGVESEMIETLKQNKDKTFDEIGRIFHSQSWFPPPMEIVDDDEDVED